MFVIFDLDNCISRDDWRVRYIVQDEPDPFLRYHKYQLLAGYDDLCHEDVIDDHITSGHKVIIMTARPEHYRAITEEWLTRNFVPYHILVMRPDDDHRHSAELKLAMFKDLKINPQDVNVAYDDRMDVVRAWNTIGVNSFQLAISNINYGEPYHEQDSTRVA